MGVAVPYESKSRAEPAKMKFLAVLLLVALAYAEPEAAPDAKADAEAAPWYYGYYGHPGYYGWGGYYGRRWGGYYGYGGYPYAYGYWKRDAEQQPDQMVKREAEEGDAKPAMLYAGYYGHYPTTLHYGVAGYPYAHHPYALAHPAVTYAAPVAPTVAVKPYTYYANSGGAVHIVKREAEAKPEAEAEASPESWYYGYYGHPYRWGGYYRGYYGYGYPYRYWWKRSAEQLQPESQHIVKRSADADADADASPESWYYGYYGHPYRWGGYYRGYYGYGYPGYYWG